MTTTQRSESINKTLKKFFSRSLILCEWVVHFERVLLDRREKERLAELATTQRKRKLLSNWKVEGEAARLYTKTSFNCFQEEYRKCLDLTLGREGGDGIIEAYVVHRPGNPNLRRLVKYSPSNQLVNCSCKRFQFEGFLCSHVLKVFRELGLSTLPSKYYLKRWRRDARKGIHFHCHEEENINDRSASSALLYSHLSHIAQRIVAKGAKDKESSTLVECKLLELEAELDGNLPIRQDQEAVGDIDSDEDQVHENNANLVLRDPKVNKRKRRSKVKRTNDLGSKKKPKKKSSSVQEDQEDAPVPPINDLGSKKRPRRRSASIQQGQDDAHVPPINDLGSKKPPRRRSTPIQQEQEDDVVPPKEQCVFGPSNSYDQVHVQGSVGLVNQNQLNRPFIHHGIPTAFSAENIHLQYPYGLQPTTSIVQTRPTQMHGIPLQYSHGFPPEASSLGYQLFPPLFDYSLMYSQGIHPQPRNEGPHPQPRYEGPARQLNFTDPSTS